MCNRHEGPWRPDVKSIWGTYIWASDKVYGLHYEESNRDLTTPHFVDKILCSVALENPNPIHEYANTKYKKL
jgi:hypothetical protein